MRPASVASLVLLLGCGSPAPEAHLHGPVELVLLHTADTHAEIFPWLTVIGAADAARGLGPAGQVAEVGGFARLRAILRSERSRAARVVHLDAGDLFQGSLAFERFGGEPEVLGFDALGVDAQTLGNHELDRGAALVSESYRALARFPLLAANYLDDAPAGLGELLEPYVVLDAGGLRVGVVGVANTTSVAALKERPNELGVLAVDAAPAVQGALDLLRPVVDAVVLVTHLGLDADAELVRRTSGADLVLGGHQHLTLDEPEWAWDCGGPGNATVRDAWGRERRCAPRRVPIVHSGAYGKYVGRVTLTLDDTPSSLGADYDPVDGHEVVALAFTLLPIRADTPDDPAVSELLAPYRSDALDEDGSSELSGYVPALVARSGATGADSPLGNWAADSVRVAAAADVAVIGASSLRHDLIPGPLDREGLVRVVPFEDPIVRAELTGAGLVRVLDHAAHSASERGCRTQVHVAGALVRFRCPCSGVGCVDVFAPATDVPCVADPDCAALGGACSAQDGAPGVCFAPVAPERAYRVATTEYVARGGSGLFDPIPETSRVRVSDGLAAALLESLREGPPCAPPAGCDSGCPAALVERSKAACAGAGRADACANPTALCEHALARCRYLPCVDARAGATRDGRIRFEEP